MNLHMKENRLHGSSAYPIVLYEMPHGDTPLSAAMHWQDDVEVLSVCRGQVTLTLDGTQWILDAGDAVWINPGQIHGFDAVGEDARCEVFIFPVQHLLFAWEDHDQQRFLRPLAEGRLGFPMRLPKNSAAWQWQNQIIFLQKERPAAYEMTTKALLVQLIGWLVQQEALIPLQPDRHDDVCKQILLYIRQHYMEKITVPMIAQAAAIAPTYFSAFFAKHFCRSFSEYLCSYRIEQACVMLRNTDRTVTEIGLATGFGSGSSFIQKFRKEKGTTPLAYRKSGQVEQVRERKKYNE